MAETLGYDNSFRYRRYVWDEETWLYYFRSRYYDPVWGRFVNADVVLGKVGKLLDHNIFSCCRQNPIAGSDPDRLYDADDPAGYFRERKAARAGRKVKTVRRVQYNVPLYNQGKTNLCWAYCQVMVEDFHAGITRTSQEADAQARKIAVSVYGEKDYDQAG